MSSGVHISIAALPRVPPGYMPATLSAAVGKGIFAACECPAWHRYRLHVVKIVCALYIRFFLQACFHLKVVIDIIILDHDFVVK